MAFGNLRDFFRRKKIAKKAVEEAVLKEEKTEKLSSQPGKQASESAEALQKEARKKIDQVREEIAEREAQKKAQEAEAAEKAAKEAEASENAAVIAPEKLLRLQLGSLRFAFDLFKASFDGKNNMLLSPLSVALALSMVEEGASGDTKKELIKTLAGDESFEEFAEILSAYVKALPSSEASKFSFADSVWFRNGFTVREDFLNRTKELFAAEACQLEFDDAAVQKINQWVRNATDNMIDSAVDKLNPEQMMVLVNALAFDGKWAAPYEEAQIREDDFTDAEGNVSRVDAMFGKESFYFGNGAFSGFIKPYQGMDYGFLAVLPSEGTGISDFVKDLNPGELIAALSSANGRCETMIPKFTFSDSRLLNETLKSLGIQNAFTSQADFSAISGEKLAIGDVIHKTFIEVNEAGTRAGAITAVMMKAMAMAPVELPKVYLNRPFVYAVIDMKTRVPFFMGVMTKPEKQEL